MKQLFFFIILTIIFVFTPFVTFAQGMIAQSVISPDDHTTQEEVEGKKIWERLQSKQITCNELSDENFGSLGEYFMGQMMGTPKVK